MFIITPIDVIDSAVKIGLGATISGLTTYWLTKTTHKKTIEKERAARKRELLEIIAEQVACFDQFALAYWERVANWIDHDHLTEPFTRLKDDLERLENQFRDGYKDLKSAEAKLLLLGEKSCQKLLRAYGLSMLVYRHEFISSRTLTREELVEQKEEHREKRELFYNELSRIY